MKMKTALFCVQTLVRGGVEKELYELCKRLKDELQITLLLLYSTDCDVEKEFEELGISIQNLKVDESYYFGRNATLFIRRIKRFKLFEAFTFVVKHFLRIGIDECNLSLGGIYCGKVRYDYAVCYHVHSPIMIKFVSKYIRSNHKYAWIHNDFSTTGFRIDKLSKYLEEYEKFIGVSETVTQEFGALCPRFKCKAITIPNSLDKRDILKKSMLEPSIGFLRKKTDDITVLTIGRLTEQKGIDLAVKICSNVVKRGFRIIWYVIGWGEEEQQIKNLIEEEKLEEHFYLLGKISNPYPLLRQCDIYAQPSRHEGYGLAIAEARILCKPIITTDFAGVREQIVNQTTGIIVPTCDVESFTEGLISLFEKKNRDRFSNALSEAGYSDSFDEMRNLFL